LSIVDCVRDVESSVGKRISVVIKTVINKVWSIRESVDVWSENKSGTGISLIDQSSRAFLSRDGWVCPSDEDILRGNCSE
jgi:hypothetical protein